MGIVYFIRNTKKDGWGYVGSSMEPNKRKSTHFSRLRNGQHSNNLLQNAVDEYGIDAFEWEVLEENIDTVEKLTEREQYYLNLRWDMLYNKSKYPHNNWNNRKHSEETKLKMSSIHSGEGNAMYGKIPNEVYRNKIREGHLKNEANLKRVRRLTEEQVRELRKEYETTDIGMRPLAIRYGISRQSVKKIIKRYTYKSIL